MFLLSLPPLYSITFTFSSFKGVFHSVNSGFEILEYIYVFFYMRWDGGSFLFLRVEKRLTPRTFVCPITPWVGRFSPIQPEPFNYGKKFSFSHSCNQYVVYRPHKHTIYCGFMHGVAGCRQQDRFQGMGVYPPCVIYAPNCKPNTAGMVDNSVFRQFV